MLVVATSLSLAACADVVSNDSGGNGGVGGGAGGNGGVGGATDECATNFDCAAEEYCFAASCGGLGTCELRPTECPLNVAFVCGCDKKTYDNACEASKAGVRIAAEGECTCEDNGDCTELDYCEGESCMGPGTCEMRPPSCPVIFDPVCGCDGNTYDSECVAEMQGVRIAADGPMDQYCAADMCMVEGTCEARPTMCPLILAPVCGCDGLTYGNDCSAAANGVRVAFNGECP